MLPNKSEKKCSFIYLVLILIIGARCLTPVLSYYIPTLYAAVLAAVWALLALIKVIGERRDNTALQVLLPLSLFIIIIFFYKFIGISTAAIGNYFNQLIFWLFIPVLMFVARYFSVSQKRVLFWALSIVICINIISNITLYSVYGDLFDNMYQLDSSAYEGLNIGGTPFVTCVLLWLCLSLICGLYDKRKLVAIFFFASVFLSTYYQLFIGRRGSVIIIGLIAIAFILLIKLSGGSKKKRRLWGSVLFFVTALVLLNGDFLLKTIASVAPERLADRAEDLLDTSHKGVSEDSFSGRAGLIELSLNTWTDNIGNFFVGKGDVRPDEDERGGAAYERTGIGGHSEFADTLARYGIVGMILVLLIYYRFYKYVKRLFMSRELKMQWLCLFWVFIILSITKGVFLPEIGCVFFLIIPLSGFIIKDNNL